MLPQQSAAYRAGYERGRQEGIQAGREDKPRGWDLEGQRELETADAGYQPDMGDRGRNTGGLSHRVPPRLPGGIRRDEDPLAPSTLG